MFRPTILKRECGGTVRKNQMGEENSSLGKTVWNFDEGEKTKK